MASLLLLLLSPLLLLLLMMMMMMIHMNALSHDISSSSEAKETYVIAGFVEDGSWAEAGSKRASACSMSATANVL
jgi:hypothetical protein